jgi:hypothetical protein
MLRRRAGTLLPPSQCCVPLSRRNRPKWDSQATAALHKKESVEHVGNPGVRFWVRVRFGTYWSRQFVWFENRSVNSDTCRL